MEIGATFSLLKTKDKVRYQSPKCKKANAPLARHLPLACPILARLGSPFSPANSPQTLSAPWDRPRSSRAPHAALPATQIPYFPSIGAVPRSSSLTALLPPPSTSHTLTSPAWSKAPTMLPCSRRACRAPHGPRTALVLASRAGHAVCPLCVLSRLPHTASGGSVSYLHTARPTLLLDLRFYSCGHGIISTLSDRRSTGSHLPHRQAHLASFRL